MLHPTGYSMVNIRILIQRDSICSGIQFANEIKVTGLEFKKMVTVMYIQPIWKGS